MCAILTAAFFGMSRNSDLLPTPPPPSSRGLHFAKAGTVVLLLTIFCLTGYILNPTPACLSGLVTILLGSGNAVRRDRGINLAHHPLYYAQCPYAHRNTDDLLRFAPCVATEIYSVHLQDSGLTSSIRYNIVGPGKQGTSISVAHLIWSL